MKRAVPFGAMRYFWSLKKYYNQKPSKGVAFFIRDILIADSFYKIGYLYNIKQNKKLNFFEIWY